jgi:microcystin degradation protein MlrC
MTSGKSKRIGLLGLHLESNAFAPVATEADFRELCYLEGDAILAEARKPAPAMPAEIPAFIAEMDKGGPWEAVPIVVTGCEPAGPIDHGFLLRLLAEMHRRLQAAGPLDGVYISNHGGMTSTGTPDPDGLLYKMVRDTVGRIPVVATIDLHANISEAMVDNVDIIVSYRTNPHVDQAERAEEAARLLRELMGGVKARTAFIRLPLTPASISLLTAAGPYADLIAAGQAMMTPELMNVSVVGGFVFSDTPKNGIAVIVTSRNEVAPARRVAQDLARKAWTERERFVRRMTPIDRAVEMSLAAARDASSPALIYSDAGDNPGGGGRGNTTWLLAALHEARATGVLLGNFIDPPLAQEAHERGVGAAFEAVFNREGETEFSRRFAVRATVRALHGGKCIGRRGLWQGKSLDLGPAAALDLGGITVVVGSRRKQCADPVFFEMMGLDIAKARTVVVKSRGHFRAGFDEFFRPGQVFEIDTAGLTSPAIERIPFRNLPRPVFPLDADAAWREPAWA